MAQLTTACTPSSSHDIEPGMKNFEILLLPADGLHAPGERHKLLIGYNANMATAINLTDEELSTLAVVIDNYRRERGEPS